jgi:hypothetical protein
MSQSSAGISQHVRGSSSLERKRCPWRQAFSSASPSWTKSCRFKSTVALRRSLRDVRGHGVGNSPSRLNNRSLAMNAYGQTDSGRPAGTASHGCGDPARLLPSEFFGKQVRRRSGCRSLTSAASWSWVLHIAFGFGSCPSCGLDDTRRDPGVSATHHPPLEEIHHDYH